MAQVELIAASGPGPPEQQPLFSPREDLAKQKIDLARMTGCLPMISMRIQRHAICATPTPPLVGRVTRLASGIRHDRDLKASEGRFAGGTRLAAARANDSPRISVNWRLWGYWTNSSNRTEHFRDGTLRSNLAKWSDRRQHAAGTGSSGKQRQAELKTSSFRSRAKCERPAST